MLLLYTISHFLSNNTESFEVKGKEGAKSRALREDINRLINENEDLRLSVARLWLSDRSPTQDERTTFNSVVSQNHKLKCETLKLK